MDQNLTKIKNLQTTLQFALVAVIFSPTFFHDLAVITKQESDYASYIGAMGILVGLYILNYAILEVMKMRNIGFLHTKFYPILNSLILTATIAFVPLFLVAGFSAYSGHIFKTVYYFFALISTWCVLWLPVVIFGILFLNLCIPHDTTETKI